MPIKEKLQVIQTELKAPKNQYNKFGDYNYRSCEDILEGIKPLLEKVKAALTIPDEIVMIGSRYYIKATATLHDLESDGVFENAAYAREPDSRPKMDEAQVTGSSSSYARKYALNGLFCIDDTKDPDASLLITVIATLSPMMVSEYKLQLPDRAVLQKKLQELINMPLLEE